MPYELTDSGRTVVVPAEKLDQARLDVAAANGVQNSPDAAGLLPARQERASPPRDYQQKLTIKRAFEGELAKTIKKIDRVRDAGVILALGEDSPYTRRTDQDPPRPSRSTMQAGRQARRRPGRRDHPPGLLSDPEARARGRDGDRRQRQLVHRRNRRRGRHHRRQERADAQARCRRRRPADAAALPRHDRRPRQLHRLVQADLDFDNTQSDPAGVHPRPRRLDPGRTSSTAPRRP